MKTALAVMLIILATAALLMSSTIIPQLLLNSVYPVTVSAIGYTFYFTTVTVLGFLLVALYLVVSDKD